MPPHGTPERVRVDRDAAVVWHGFTQMATYADNSPVIVERAEGRELIDVDGRRYLDAISSLWVTTLGHRVPELDAAAVDQLGPGRALDAARQRQPRHDRVRRGARSRSCPWTARTSCSPRDGAAAVEQALKIAFQFWTNQGVTGRTSYLAFGGAYHGDTIGSLSVGAGGFGTDIFDPLRFPVRAGPRLRRPGCIEAACAMVAEHAERAGRGRRGAHGAGRRGHPGAPAARVRRARRACAASTTCC